MRLSAAAMTAGGASPAPNPGYLFVRTKRYQKAAQGLRPLGIPQFLVYLPFAVAGLILPTARPLRLPLPIVYPRILSEDTAVAHRRGALLLCSDSEGPPRRLYPFKRPAGGVG